MTDRNIEVIKFIETLRKILDSKYLSGSIGEDLMSAIFLFSLEIAIDEPVIVIEAMMQQPVIIII